VSNSISFDDQLISIFDSIGINRQDVSINRIEGGKNNRTFAALIDKKPQFLIKHYFKDPQDNRDRLGIEFSFISFMWYNGIRTIPKPIACDNKSGIGIYSFIEGKHINQEELKKDHIHQAVKFFLHLNTKRNNNDAYLLPIASDACFSICDHLMNVEKRINRLNRINDDDSISKQAINLIQNRIYPTWKNLKKKCIKQFEKENINIFQLLQFNECCLSPSDFGFHNALVTNEKQLVFIDFEYAGWDDPIKPLCDFFSHPDIQIPYKFFIKSLRSISSYFCSEKLGAVAEILYPVYKIKWCCIMLNEFMPIDIKRRCFAQSCKSKYRIKEKQLTKINHYFEKYFQDEF